MSDACLSVSEVTRENTPQWTGCYSHLRSEEANFCRTKDRIFECGPNTSQVASRESELPISRGISGKARRCSQKVVFCVPSNPESLFLWTGTKVERAPSPGPPAGPVAGFSVTFG